MYDKSAQYLNRLPRVLGCEARARFALLEFSRSAVFGFASNRPTHRPSDCSNYLAQFRLRSEPYMNYPD
jgi:hypothetical protein